MASFEVAKELYLDAINQNSIGLLNQKNLHGIIKFMICDDVLCHEVKVDGKVIDVFVDDTVYEIQSAQFRLLRDKITKFTEQYPMKIIFPIVVKKQIQWLDQEKGIQSKRVSPKKGKLHDVLRELYQIRDCLNNDNLSIECYFFDVDGMLLSVRVLRKLIAGQAVFIIKLHLINQKIIDNFYHMICLSNLIQSKFVIF